MRGTEDEFQFDEVWYQVCAMSLLKSYMIIHVRLCTCLM